ncbi:MFS transporter [Micromonospora aurantiaca (nom. illeg.)]|uniref:MFS transporter n=1 Tax=Micromonospora aurantiaca (nom. illeg.) TaxID=47850 RepID=UPI0016570A7F|nr:MFS transporter [Micromonospora aurantiaca]MBC9002303.1 MFS transporter [Micromonospora aurantiaca]
MTQPDPRRWAAVAALVLAALTLGFDITILIVALPPMAGDLSAGTSALQWIVNAYILVLAGLILTCGALGDRYGRKRLLIAGLTLLAAASAAAAWTGGREVLPFLPGHSPAG